MELLEAKLHPKPSSWVRMAGAFGCVLPGRAAFRLASHGCAAAETRKGARGVRNLLSHGSLKAKKLFIDTIQALEKDLLL